MTRALKTFNIYFCEFDIVLYSCFQCVKKNVLKYIAVARYREKIMKRERKRPLTIQYLKTPKLKINVQNLYI